MMPDTGARYKPANYYQSQQRSYGYNNQKRQGRPNANKQRPNGGSAEGGGGAGASGFRAGGARGPVLALHKTRCPADAAGPAAQLRTEILWAEESDSTIEGALLGIAAAAASRLGLRDLCESLCAFAWCRLADFGGREVAELATAALKLDCVDMRFFNAAADFCKNCTSANFRNLRDVAQLATALQKAAAESVPGRGLEEEHLASAFLGLSKVAAVHLQQDDSSVRDLAELLSAVGQVLTKRLRGGEVLHEKAEVDKLFGTALPAARQQMHRASPQDVAKISSAAARAWTLMVRLREAVIKPCLIDVAQALRYRLDAFNSQDVSSVMVALAKTDTVVDNLIGSSLDEQVAKRVKDFSNKELCLTLWAITRHGNGWVANGHARLAAMREVRVRNLSNFSAQDLCMCAQAAARLHESAGAEAVARLGSEAFARQLQGLATSEKAALLWSLAKAKVENVALTRLLVRHLGMDDFMNLPRERTSGLLWALGGIFELLPPSDTYAEKLVRKLNDAKPWANAPSYEVATAAWAFKELPASLISDAAWLSLAAALQEIRIDGLPIHELCNLVAGFSAWPTSLQWPPSMREDFTALATYAAQRPELSGAGALTEHDQASLTEAIQRVRQGRLHGQDCPASGNIAEALRALIRDLVSSDGAARPPVPPVRHQRVPRATAAASDTGGCGDTGGSSGDSGDYEGSSVDPPPAPPYDGDLCQVIHTSPIPRRRERLGSSPWRKLAAPEHGLGHSSGYAHGHTYAHWDGHSHGHTYDPGLGHGHHDVVVDGVAVDAGHSWGHGSDEKASGACTEPSCCPTMSVSASGNDWSMRVNSHCNFQGHCVQMKNTFLHVECLASDSDSDTNCMVCQMKRRRARSADHTQMREFRDEGELGDFRLPPSVTGLDLQNVSKESESVLDGETFSRASSLSKEESELAAQESEPPALDV